MAKQKSTKKDKSSKKKRIDFKGIKETTIGLLQLVVFFAQSVAAYILWFQGSMFMQVVAGILAISAAHIAVTKFTK